jgi:pilus assembly protein CpaB
VNRLTPAKVTMLMLFVMGGLIVAYIAKNLFASNKGPAGPATRNVPMALADIPEGTLITTAHVGTGPVLESDLQRDVLLSMPSILGRITRTKLTAATPIRTTNLYGPGETPPLNVADGFDAVTIVIDGPSALMSGLVKPTELVDIHFTPVTDNLSRRRVRGGFTMTLIKGIKVLAINGKTQQSRIDGDRNTITVEATKAQANILLQAQEHGKMTLVSNTTGKGDTEIALADADRAYFEEILGLEPEKKDEAKEEKKPFVSQAYVGDERGDLYFRDGRRISEIQINTGRAPSSDPDDEAGDVNQREVDPSANNRRGGAAPRTGNRLGQPGAYPQTR